MKLRIAKTAGFCYGVKRAVSIAERTAAEGECWCLGELIHNRFETDRLSRLGIRTAAAPEEIPDGAVTIIRSRGRRSAVSRAYRNCGPL